MLKLVIYKMCTPAMYTVNEVGVKHIQTVFDQSDFDFCVKGAESLLDKNGLS